MIIGKSLICSKELLSYGYCLLLPNNILQMKCFLNAVLDSISVEVIGFHLKLRLQCIVLVGMNQTYSKTTKLLENLGFKILAIDTTLLLKKGII